VILDVVIQIPVVKDMSGVWVVGAVIVLLCVAASRSNPGGRTGGASQGGQGTKGKK
jgi:hypothetical protein